MYIHTYVGVDSALFVLIDDQNLEEGVHLLSGLIEIPVGGVRGGE